MKADAKIALVTLGLIIVVLVAYLVFVPGRPDQTANQGSISTNTLATAADQASGTPADQVEPVVTPLSSALPATQPAADATVPGSAITSALQPATQPAAPSPSTVLTPSAALTPSASQDPTALSSSPTSAAPSAPLTAAPSAAGPVQPSLSQPGTTAGGPAVGGQPVTSSEYDWEALLRGNKTLDQARTASAALPAASASTGTQSGPGPQVTLTRPPTGSGALPGSQSAGSSAIGTSGTYTVQKGDTLSTIAAKAYGSSTLWPHITRANPDVNPNRLKVGTVLRMPDPSVVSPASSSSAASTPVEVTSTSSGSALVLDPARQYQVIAGDSLEKISRRLYGDASQVNAIYEANRSLIGPDPARLKVRMVLTLPTPPTRTQR